MTGFPNIAAEAIHRYWCDECGHWFGVTGSVCDYCGGRGSPYIQARDMLACPTFERSMVGAEWRDLIDAPVVHEGPVPPTRIHLEDVMR